MKLFKISKAAPMQPIKKLPTGVATFYQNGKIVVLEPSAPNYTELIIKHFKTLKFVNHAFIF